MQNAIDEARTKMQEMATNGVKSVVYFFYPHLSTAGGGILQTPAPAVNETLDYAYPLVEQLCCGSSFTSSGRNADLYLLYADRFSKITVSSPLPWAFRRPSSGRFTGP